jgi:hypothetical protein
VLRQKAEAAPTRPLVDATVPRQKMVVMDRMRPLEEMRAFFKGRPPVRCSVVPPVGLKGLKIWVKLPNGWAEGML